MKESLRYGMNVLSHFLISTCYSIALSDEAYIEGTPRRDTLWNELSGPGEYRTVGEHNAVYVSLLVTSHLTIDTEYI